MMGPVSAPTPTGPRPSATAGSPPARRQAGPSWRDPRLVVGILIVAASVLLGARLLGGADDTVGVWAVRHAQSAGASLQTGDLVRRQLRFADSADADRYVSAERGVPPGATLLRDIGPGELLPRSAVGQAGRQSLVEVPLSVDAAAVPATVRVGSVVDVWVTPDRIATKARPTSATRVFHDVSVVSVPRSGDSLGPVATRQVIIGLGGGSQAALPDALAALASGTVTMTRQG